MLLFVLTALAYSGALLLVRPPPESLRSAPLSFAENFRSVKGSLFVGLLLCTTFLLTTDLTFLQIDPDALALFGISNVSEVAYLWPVQVFTNMFIHEGITHLLGNLATLGLIGSTYERRVGTRRFVKVLFAGGLASGASVLFRSQAVVSCGISGGLVGVAAAHFIDFQGMSKREFSVALAGFVLLLFLYSLPSNDDLREPGFTVDHLGHVFGAVGAVAYCKSISRRDIASAK